MNPGQKYFLQALGRNGREGFPNHSWDRVEPLLRICWEHSQFSAGLPWEGAAEVAKQSWSAGSRVPREFARDLGRNARWTSPELDWDHVEPMLSVAWHNCCYSETVG